MAIEPQTDREILVSLSKDMEQMKSTFAQSIERLSDSIDRFGESLKELDEGKIMEISTRLKSIEVRRTATAISSLPIADR